MQGREVGFFVDGLSQHAVTSADQVRSLASTYAFRSHGALVARRHRTSTPATSALAPNIHPCHICAGTEHPPVPHLRRDWLTSAIIVPRRGRPLPRVHRDWARPPDDVIAGGRSFGADTRELAFRDAQYPRQYRPCTALYPTPNSLYAAEYCLVPSAAPSHRTRDGRAHCLAVYTLAVRPHRNGCQRYSGY